MERTLDSETKETMKFTAHQLFHELTAHYHNYMLAQQLQDRELPRQSSDAQALYLGIIAPQNYAMLVLTLCKVMEFHTAFRQYLKDDLRTELDAINSRISKSGILSYRNKYVGHLFDKKTGKPLDPQKVLRYWDALLDGQTEAQFRKWWWSTRQEPELKSVAGVMVRIVKSMEKC